MKKLLFVLFVITICFSNTLATDVPYLMGRINDYAGIISDEAKLELDQILREHEMETSNQIVILTILSLEDEILENFANDVFNTWGIGQKGKDNGVLLLVSLNDKKIRIEVGYGLEGELTDAECSSIIRNEMAPNFRRGDYSRGITSAVRSIIGAIEGYYDTTEPEYISENFETVPFPLNIFIGIFVMSILGIFTVVGVFSKGCSSWFLFFFLIPFYSTFPIFLFGPLIATIILICYITGYIGLKIILGSKAGRKLLKNRMPKLDKAFTTMKSWSNKSGSSSGGWSSGGGGFSGGGGSSGGGGASGGW
ncbi:TPM domain-containing protein [Bacteroidota bacterium]